MRTLPFRILGALVAALPALALAAEVEVVEVTGEAAIVGENKPAATERAREEGLRRAVEQVCGTMISASSETRDFMLVRDSILTQARGYVSGYEELEKKEDGGVMLVKLRVKVGKDQLSEDVAAVQHLISAKGLPRMAVLIAEQQIGQAAPSMWWGPQGGGAAPGPVVTIDQRIVENTLIDEWGKTGFGFVDLQALAGKLRTANVVVTNPTGDQAREVGNLSDADVVIVGTAVATKAGDLAGYMNTKPGEASMVSCKGVVSLRIFNADNGEILGTAEGSKTSLNIETFACGRLALIAAAKQVAGDLQNKLIAKWAKEQGGSLRVRMIVKGIESFKILNDFKAGLQTSIQGIQRVDQRSFKDGVADLDLRIKGTTEGLAGDLDGQQVGKVKPRVTSLTANTIEVNLAK